MATTTTSTRMVSDSFVPLSKELKVLELSLPKLRRAITDPRLLSLDLLAAELISEGTLQKVNIPTITIDSQNYHLLSDLRYSIACRPDNYYKLLEVLEDNPPLLSAIANEMRETYTSITLTSTQHLSASLTGETKQDDITCINVCQKVQKKHLIIQGKLAQLFFNFQKAIHEVNVDINDLKQFIILCRPHEEQEVKEEIRKATNLYELFDTVRTRLCSLVNYTILVQIAEQFKITQAFAAIEAYEKEEQNYRKILLSTQFAEELKKENELSHQRHCTAKNTIVLRLKWSSVKPLTVAEFESIIKEVFSDFITYIHILKVEAGSVIVTMSAPERIMKGLVVMAKRKVSYLREVNVIWLLMGEEKVIQLSPQELKVQDKITKLEGIDNKQVTKPPESIQRIQSFNDEGDDIDGPASVAREECDDTATEEAIVTWRHCPVKPRDVMIIGSYGNLYNKDMKQRVSHKIIPNELKGNDNWMIEEIDRIEEMYKMNPEQYHIRYVCRDLPGREKSKDYYIELIKDLFINSKHNEIAIRYTGHGEKETGNWCFKDGVITFQDIFTLYKEHFKGKSVIIISDCSYSGKWIHDCAQALDTMMIPACGHYSRVYGMLLAIFTSCGASEESTALSYLNEAIHYGEIDKKILHSCGRRLTSGQITQRLDFRYIFCDKLVNESCEMDFNFTWSDRAERDHFLLKIGHNLKENDSCCVS